MMQKLLIRFGWLILTIAGLGMAYLFYQFAQNVDREALTAVPLIYYGSAFAIYGLVLWYIHRFWGKSYLSLEAIVLFAVLFRLIFLFHDPLFDDSVYRQAWDGKVFNAGVHPYEITPSSDRLRGFQDEVIYPKVAGQNHVSQSAPVSLYLFRAVSLFTDSPMVYRIVILLFDIATILILISLLRYMERATAWIAVYAWNPLLIVESAGHAREMMIGVLLFAAGLSFALRCRSLYGSFFTAVASTVHWLILPVIPFFEDTRSRWKTWTGMALITAAVWIIVNYTPDYLPFSLCAHLSAGWWGQENNSSLFAGIQYLYGLAMHDAPSSFSAARTTAFVLFIAAWIISLFLYWKKSYVSQKQNMIRFVYVIMMFALLLSPVMNPAVLLIMIPVLCFCPSPAWILLTGLTGLYYFRPLEWLSGNEWYQSLALYEYAPFYIVLSVSLTALWIKKRRAFHHPEKHHD